MVILIFLGLRNKELGGALALSFTFILPSLTGSLKDKNLNSKGHY
jgi:hypothetical protein